MGGIGAWAAFLAYAANQERLASSAMRRVLSELRESEDVRAVLGDAVRPEPAWYLNGSPWVHGSVRHPTPTSPIPPTPLFYCLLFLFLFLPRAKMGDGIGKKRSNGGKSQIGSADPSSRLVAYVCVYRLRCCKGISTSAFALKVTGVGPLQTSLTWPCSAHTRASVLSHRRRHGVLYEYTQSARRTFHDVYVPLSPVRSLRSHILSHSAIQNYRR